jgi:HEAT repeat protein
LFSRDIRTEIVADDFWDKLFDTEILAALVHALSDEDSDIKRHVVKIFTSAIPRGTPHCFHNIHTEIVAEGFRDKIFDTEIVAALVHALGDKDSYVKSSAGYFFTAAIAQGVPRCFRRVFILK